MSCSAFLEKTLEMMTFILVSRFLNLIFSFLLQLAHISKSFQIVEVTANLAPVAIAAINKTKSDNIERERAMREKEIAQKSDNQANKMFSYLATGAVVGASVMRNLEKKNL